MTRALDTGLKQGKLRYNRVVKLSASRPFPQVDLHEIAASE
jgi:hypothetical protein